MDDKDKEFERKLENNLDEIREGDAAGAKIQEEMAKQPPVNEQTWQDLMKQEQGERATITEAEARRMIDEEREKTVKVLKQTNAKSKRTLVVVLVVAVILCVLGVVFALVMGNRKGEQTGGSGENVPGQEVKPEEKPGEETGAEGAEVEELALDDELVQRVYHNFDIVSDAFSRTAHFYAGKGRTNAEVDNLLMAGIVISLAQQKAACAGDYGEALTQYGCYDTQELQKLARQVFGRELDLETEEPVAYTGCHGWTVNTENDEVYDSIGPGCGGQCVPAIVRDKTKAERQGDQIIIYERAYMESCAGIYHVGEVPATYDTENGPMLRMNSLELGEAIAEREVGENGEFVNNLDVEQYADKLDTFKWTFTKNADGEYIFSGLERIEK